MDSGFLDVLHDPSNVDGVAVANAVDVDLDRIVQITVDQHRILAGDAHCLTHVPMQAGAVVNDLHRPPAQHVTGPDHDGEADAVGDFLRLARGPGDAVFRLQQA